MRVALGVLVLLSSCEPVDDSFQISGYNMDTFFPFDGARTWEFTTTEAESRQMLIATLDPESTTLDDGSRVHEVSYDLVCIDVNDETCEDEWVRSLVWSTSRANGVAIRELHAPAGDVVFDEPVYLAAGEMTVGDTIESGDFTATFFNIEPCPVLWTDQWDTCVHLILEGGSGLAGEHLAGEYWAVSNFNMVSFQLANSNFQWQLSDATFEPTR